jgi:hypothetical protein
VSNPSAFHWLEWFAEGHGFKYHAAMMKRHGDFQWVEKYVQAVRCMMRGRCSSMALVACMILAGCGKPDVELGRDGVVSWDRLLADAAELKSPVPGRSILFSSTTGAGKAMLTGGSPQIYGDLDHGSFLDVKDVPGGVEATLAEMDGAGAITWMWSANPVGELVLEVDGEETVYAFKAFLAGKWLPVGYPFAAKSAEGYNLHFPILHKARCRVALRASSRSELGAMFYQVAWNAIDPECEIEPFDMDAVRKEKAALSQLARMLSHPPGFVLHEIFTGRLVPDAAADVLSIPGVGTIQCLEISAASKGQLADVYVEAFWDGGDAPAISCPLHMLCGVSPRIENVQSLPVTVSRATATLRWPMPFSEGARIRLKNVGKSEIRLRVSASIDGSRSSPRRFLGSYSNHGNLQSDEPNVVSLAGVSGGGAIAGCILQVENRSGAWWGEGDPLIWLDAKDRPAWRGTGTEDYFGFAWCSEKKFQHPFRGQTKASPSFAAMYRYHILDALPFSEWARFDFEAHGTGSGSMDYSALVLWYSGETLPGGVSNPDWRP